MTEQESAYQRGYLDGMAKGKRDAERDAIESRVLAERKPVAWMDGIVHLYFDREMLDEEKTSGDFTPLFAHPTPDDANVSVATLFEVLMQQNIVTSDESYLSLRCVGVPPTEEEFVQAVRRTIDAAIDRARQSGEEGK